MAEHHLSERHACRLLEVDRSTYRYEPRPDHNAKLRTALLEAARQKARFGYRRLWVLLTTRQGFKASIGRVQRLYHEEGLAVRRQKRKRLKGIATVNPSISRPNQEWALDFVSDAISTGRALRALTMREAARSRTIQGAHRGGSLFSEPDRAARAGGAVAGSPGRLSGPARVALVQSAQAESR